MLGFLLQPIPAQVSFLLWPTDSFLLFITEAKKFNPNIAASPGMDPVIWKCPLLLSSSPRAGGTCWSPCHPLTRGGAELSAVQAAVFGAGSFLPLPLFCFFNYFDCISVSPSLLCVPNLAPWLCFLFHGQQRWLCPKETLGFGF